MKGYKAPSFQDRAAASATAKEKALAKMKAAPQLTEAELAERAARRVEREAAAEAKAAAARAAREEKQRLADEKQRLAEEEREAAKAEQARLDEANAPPPPKTEEELKAARDARYAARKKRK